MTTTPNPTAADQCERCHQAEAHYAGVCRDCQEEIQADLDYEDAREQDEPEEPDYDPPRPWYT